MDLNGIIVFFVGFFSGSVFVWYFRKKEVELITKSQFKLEKIFDDISDSLILYKEIKKDIDNIDII